MKAAIALGLLLALPACARHDTTPYASGVVPPTPVHCGESTCAASDYCRTDGRNVRCASVPVIGL